MICNIIYTGLIHTLNPHEVGTEELHDYSARSRYWILHEVKIKSRHLASTIFTNYLTAQTCRDKWQDYKIFNCTNSLSTVVHNALSGLSLKGHIHVKEEECSARNLFNVCGDHLSPPNPPWVHVTSFYIDLSIHFTKNTVLVTTWTSRQYNFCTIIILQLDFHYRTNEYLFALSLT